jgi:hypothetical protein
MALYVRKDYLHSAPKQMIETRSIHTCPGPVLCDGTARGLVVTPSI